MQSTFCVFPWLHLNVNPDGTASLCCRALGVIKDNGLPMTLEHHSLDAIWDSAAMREVRAAMLTGKPVTACRRCYEEEARYGHSYRTRSLEQWVPRLGRELPGTLGDAGPTPSLGAPRYYQLNLDTRCNLKCRMCSSVFSSSIEKDPVHAAWTPATHSPTHMFPKWKGCEAFLFPARETSLRVAGCHAPEIWNDQPLCWTAGRAVLEVPVRRDVPLAGIEVSLHDMLLGSRHGTVSVNGRVFGVIDPARRDRVFAADLSDLRHDGILRVEVATNATPVGTDKRDLGVPLAGVVLRRQSPRTASQTPFLDSRFASPGKWHTQPAVLYGELLNDLDKLEKLYFTGGEPLAIPQFHDILDYCINLGRASKVSLKLNSNCTLLDAAFVEKIKAFESVEFTISMDAAGPDYEYIRYPARWEKTSANIRLLVGHQTVKPAVAIVMQAYNFMNITTLCDFLDAQGIPFFMLDAIGPHYVEYYVMPRPAREIAAARLTEYLQTRCRPGAQGTVRQMIGNLLSQKDACTRENMATFLAFTNDLDRSRGQSFKDCHPQLHQCIQDSGLLS